MLPYQNKYNNVLKYKCLVLTNVFVITKFLFDAVPIEVFPTSERKIVSKWVA